LLSRGDSPRCCGVHAVAPAGHGSNKHGEQDELVH
jgi:hypothetical protein